LKHYFFTLLEDQKKAMKILSMYPAYQQRYEPAAAVKKSELLPTKSHGDCETINIYRTRSLVIYEAIRKNSLWAKAGGE
jgi:hypothetical protein